MTRSLFVTLAVLAVALPTASAQSSGDSTADARQDAAREVLVLSVVYHIDRYVYDVYDGNETEAVLYNSTGTLIVRSPQSKQRVMVVLEPDGQYAATSGPNAIFLSPFDSVGQFVPRTADYLAMSDVTTHAVHVFICASDSDDPFTVNDLGTACRSWTEIGPISDSPGLTLVIINGPELGGGRNRPGDDG